MLRTALCGAGRWGSRLIESVQGKSDKIKFVTVVTRNPAGQQALADKFGVTLTSHYADVLADSGIDAVVLATPHSHHHQEIVAAAKAGKHLFVEKPFTLTRASAQDAVDACKAAGVTLAMGFNRRYAPTFIDMMRRIGAGEIGHVLHVEANFSGPSGYLLKADNWRSNQTESPAGAMTARGVHALDAMLQVAGPVAKVYAFSDRREISVDVDDTTSCLMRFANGVTGSLATLHASVNYWRVHVFGSKGALEMRGDTELLFFEPDGKMTRHTYDAVDKERAELEAFADAVAKKIDFLITPEEIVNNVAVMEAMVKSARTGQPVNIG
jgi:predicted dehydrogenase